MSQYKYMIVGDTHIDEDCLLEVEQTFIEIEKIKAKEIIFLGDVFHKNNPTPKEINFVLKWFKRFLLSYKTVTVILGNHDLYGGFQTTKLLKYLGVEVRSSYSVNKITSIGNILLGHFFVSESKDNYSENPVSILDHSKNYKYVFLGHQHRFQELASNAWHLGSIRYVGFGEYEEPITPKKIALIDSYGSVTFKDLKTPDTLKQFNNVDQMYKHYQNRKKDDVILDKIRLKYLDFDTYKKDINNLDSISLPLYYKIKIKLDFANKQIVRSYETGIKQKQITTEAIVKKWLDSIKDKDVKCILEKESSSLCD